MTNDSSNEAVIREIRETELPEQFQSDAMYAITNDDERKEAIAAFKSYCKSNGIFYYARVREDFFPWEARDLAIAAGCTSMILEDLS